MQIEKKQLAGKPKKVGDLDGRAVFSLVTKGGCHLLVAPKGTSFETLAVAPHRAVARHIAMKQHKSIKWQELSKGDWLDPKEFEHILPKYEALTKSLQDRQNKKEQ